MTRMTISEHFEAASRIREGGQNIVSTASGMHEREVVRIDERIFQMDILAFGIVGAVIALNATLSIDNLFSVIGILILIGNAFWNFIAQVDQMRINRDSAYGKAEHTAAILKEFLDVYRNMCADFSDTTEAALDVAGDTYFKKLNERSFIRAPRTNLTKWLGQNGYFILYASGLLCLLFGFMVPVSISDLSTLKLFCLATMWQEYLHFWASII